MARVKAWLLATRRTTRDYLDLVVLLERLGEGAGRAAFVDFDAIYDQLGPVSPLSEVVERLAEARPADFDQVDLASYRGLVSPWDAWGHVSSRGRAWATALADATLRGAP